MHRLNPVLPALLATILIVAPAVAGGRTTLVREALDLASRRSGRELLEHGARESAEQAVEAAVQKYGPKAASAIADGGLELVEAGARYGDDVMRIALDAGPAARRTLALDAGNLVPLVKELGPEALELETRSPGMARRVFTSFGPDGGRRIAMTVPADDVPRLVAYAERADTPHTRQLLLECYRSEGPSIFERIPPTLVLAAGLTAATIYGTHRVTSPVAAVADQIQANPALAQRTIDWMMIIAGLLSLTVTTACLWRFGMLGRRDPASRTDRDAPRPG